MTDTPASVHGEAVGLTRDLIKWFAAFSTRGVFKLSSSKVDCFVMLSTLLTIMVVVGGLVSGHSALFSVYAVYAAWRIYDIFAVQLLILIYDRSAIPDPGYRSAPRAFVLALYNLLEFSLLTLILKFAIGRASPTDSCDFDRFEIAAAHFAGLFQFNYLERACVSPGWLANLAWLTVTVVFALLVLVVLARTASSLPFPDRSKPG